MSSGKFMQLSTESSEAACNAPGKSEIPQKFVWILEFGLVSKVELIHLEYSIYFCALFPNFNKMLCVQWRS